MESTLRVGELVKFDKTSDINRNDIVVFRMPNNETYYTFRLVADSGDSLLIDESEVYINGKIQRYPPTIQHAYHIPTSRTLDEAFFEAFDVREFTQFPGQAYLIQTTQKRASALKKDGRINRITKAMMKEGNPAPNLYAGFNSSGWNASFFGPLWIPCQGCSIEVDERSKKIYSSLAETYEGNNLVVGKTYTFEKDYVFVLGDNRSNAADSRYIGFVPKESIVGKIIKE